MILTFGKKSIFFIYKNEKSIELIKEGKLKQTGKITITSLIILLMMAYGVFVAVKLISASFQDTQIAKEVKDKVGYLRNSSNVSAARVQEEIIGILMKKDIIFDKDDDAAVSVEIDRASLRIHYSYKYEVETNLIFFKKRRPVEVRDVTSEL